MGKHKNLNRGKCAGALMLTAILCLSSCTEDEPIFNANEITTSGEGICFGLADAGDAWNDNSRSAQSESGFVLRSTETDDTLCVSTRTEYGIHTSSDQVQSRAVRQKSLGGKSFEVSAYYYPTDATVPSLYYIDHEQIDVAQDGASTTMKSGNVYYWPMEGSMTFLATAGSITVNDKDGNGKLLASPTLTYTVNEKVGEQEDAMAAYVSTPINYHDTDTKVGLTFQHLCAAIQFQLSDKLTTNTISKITISNVYGGASYTYSSTDGWTKSSNTGKANATYEAAVTVSSGTVITSDETSTTMLLAPQTLTEDAQITVSFSDGRADVASVAGKLKDYTWEAGKTYVYKMGISPDYTLEFNETSIPIADCHYEIRNINVTTKNFPSDMTWTINAYEAEYISEKDENNNPTLTIKATTNVADWVKFRTKPTNTEDLYFSGYYCEEQDNYTQSGTDDPVYKSTTNLVSNSLSGSSDADILLYISENTGTGTVNTTDSVRTAIIRITDSNGKVSAELPISQYYPIWNDGKAYERIEENNGGPYPWGFAWTHKVTYEYENIEWTDIIGGLVRLVRYYIFKYWHYDSTYMTLNGSATSNWSVTIDYSQLSGLSGIADGADGLVNTEELYNASPSVSVESWLSSRLELKTDPVNIDMRAFAVYKAVMKNKFKQIYTTGTNSSGSDTSISEEIVDIQWYLPSTSEIGTLKSTANSEFKKDDENYKLSGTYWSSNVVDSEEVQQAYYYDATGTTGTAARTTEYKIRAARQKPTTGNTSSN